MKKLILLLCFVAAATSGYRIVDDDITLGRRANEPVKIFFDVGLGSSNPYLFWDSVTSTFKIKRTSGGELYLIDESSTQSISGKDIDGGTASNTSRLTIPQASTGTISGLTRKKATIFYDTTTDKITSDNGSTLRQVVTEAEQATLTNKDIDGGTASNSSRFTLSKDTTANLAALTAKQATLFYDTTLDVIKYADGTSLKTLDAEQDYCTKVYKTGNQSLTTTSPAIIAFDAELFDQGSQHDNVTNNSRITVGKTGIYSITAVSLAVNASNDFDFHEINFTKNGASVQRISSGQGFSSGTYDQEAHSGTAILSLTAGDYIELSVRYDFNVGSMDVYGGATNTTLAVCWLQN